MAFALADPIQRRRPETVLAGNVRWSDYRSAAKPTVIEIEHHKSGAQVPHPLEGTDDAGNTVLDYAEAEKVLATLPKRGLPFF